MPASGYVRPTWRASLLAQCRRCDVSQSRSAGSSIWTAGRASPIGRHHHQRPSLASSIGGPLEGGTNHGRSHIIVADRASAGIGSVRLFIYLFINLFIPPACNGWGPWLRLLRGRCNITDESISLLGMGSTRADLQADPPHIHCCPDQTLQAGGEH